MLSLRILLTAVRVNDIYIISELLDTSEMFEKNANRNFQNPPPLRLTRKGYKHAF